MGDGIIGESTGRVTWQGCYPGVLCSAGLLTAREHGCPSNSAWLLGNKTQPSRRPLCEHRAISPTLPLSFLKITQFGDISSFNKAAKPPAPCLQSLSVCSPDRVSTLLVARHLAAWPSSPGGVCVPGSVRRSDPSGPGACLMVYVALLLWVGGRGEMLYPWCTIGKAGAEQVSHSIASLLAALANPQILWSFLYQASHEIQDFFNRAPLSIASHVCTQT